MSVETRHTYTLGYANGYRAGQLAMRDRIEIAAKAVNAPTALLDFLRALEPEEPK